MKLSIGDVLVGLERGQDPEAVFMAAFTNSEWSNVYEDRLYDGFPTVFGMVFENMPTALAEKLTEALFVHAGFMGAISIHLEFPPHLVLYRSRLPLHYRLEGRKLRSFYSMGDQEGCDPSDLESMQRLGYDDTDFENKGAGRTILDDFDTPRHFERVAAFRELLTSWLSGDEDDSYQLTMMLEDLSPKLFNALGAAAERLSSAENEEEVAQVAVSGRRYLEQLADALFPPTDAPRGKRILNKKAYRNRLWAFAENHLQDDPERLSTIGSEIDRVVGELNACLHADQSKDRVARSIADAALLTAALFALNPSGIRNGYLAYMGSLRAFVGKLSAQSRPAYQSN
ncbi:hypothetical protein [Pararhodobacter oceanensis]|uniref:hypothetical protein n=1 Tax=Pararhodobacter oceanensis TaxID=2172121 RepID=UPI003A9340BF